MSRLPLPPRFLIICLFQLGRLPDCTVEGALPIVRACHPLQLPGSSPASFETRWVKNKPGGRRARKPWESGISGMASRN